MKTEPRRNPPQKRRLPRRVTAAHLENAALHYLERFSSSSANLRRVLMRKVARSARAHGTDPAEGVGLVEAAYAVQKAASLRRRGASRYGIRGKLAVKGVDAEFIDAALERLDGERGSGDLGA